MVSNMKFKKILIIGQNFNNDSGGGITLTNLFSGWPNDKIAVATFARNITKISFERTKNIYQLGGDEISTYFPFSLFKKKHESSIVKQYLVQNEKPMIQSNMMTFIRRFFIMTFYSFVKNTGIYNFVNRVRLSKKLDTWVSDFKPDIIYTQLGSLVFMDLVYSIGNKYKVPAVIHIMDDWPSTIPGYLGFILKKEIHNRVQRFFDFCSVHLVISQYMAIEYTKRYGNNWTTFRNCIEFDFWNRPGFYKKEFSVNRKYTVLYAGRVGIGTTSSLLEFAEGIEDLLNNGYNITFKVQTNNQDHPVVKKLKKLKCVQFVSRIPYKELPNRFSSVDLLVLPLDFDKIGYTFIKYSMPTKVPEYMASGTPIIVYAPQKTALSYFAKTNNIAMIVNERDKTRITSSLKKLINDPEIAKSFSKRAAIFAKKNQDSSIVQQNFYKAIMY